ncbi:MAG: DUF2878 domain-containing protein [Pseudomonadota bacterium]
MSKYFIANFVFFQCLWFSCVLGAGAYQWHWLAIGAVVPITVLTWFSPHRNTDFLITLIAVCIGLIIDNLWVATGILEYPHNTWAPYWIGILWYGLGLTINHSMAFFRDHQPWGSIIVGAAAPITYLTAQKFGSVAITSTLQMAFISLSWMVLFYGLSRFSLLLINTQMHENQSQSRRAAAVPTASKGPLS